MMQPRKILLPLTCGQVSWIQLLFALSSQENDLLTYSVHSYWILIYRFSSLITSFLARGKIGWPTLDQRIATRVPPDSPNSVANTASICKRVLEEAVIEYAESDNLFAQRTICLSLLR